MVTARHYMVMVVCLFVTLVGGGGRTAVAERRPPVAAVFLVEGSKLAMGNGTYARPNDCRGHTGPQPCRVVKAIPGAHQELRAAIGNGPRGIAAHLGGGARAALVTYGRYIRTLAPMGPARLVTGKRLGSQQSFANESGNDLVRGLETAYDLLALTDAERKVVFVIGDGFVNDSRRSDLKDQFVAAGIAIVFLEFRASIEFQALDQQAVDELARQHAFLGGGDDGSHAVTVASPAELGTALRVEVDRWRARR